MKTDNGFPPDKFVELRNRAQEYLSSTPSKQVALSHEDVKKLVEELNTYQIELELQNQDLRTTQEELGQTQRRFTDLYDFAPIGYLTVSEKGLIVEANLTATDMLGVERRSLIKQPISNFFHPKHQDSHYLCRKKLLETKEVQTCETLMRRKDGSEFAAQCKYIIDAYVDGHLGQFRMTLTDISKQKEVERQKEKLQSQLHQSQKMQAIGTMAGGIAHEFNNLLGVIMGCVDMARDEVPTDSFAKRQLDKVLKASYRMKDLVKQILTFSHQGKSKLNPVNLCPLVEELVQLITSSIPTSIEIKADIDSACGNTMVDPHEIQQIVMNLFSNAVFAMKEKGVLSISMKPVNFAMSSELLPNSLSAGSYIKLSFGDTGCGIDKKTLPHIFDPFFTTKEVGQGTGMGLSIVYGIMGSHRGTITVESEVGKGATFHLYFPVTDAPVVEADQETGADEGGSEKILFVDDQEMYAEMGAEMVGRLGYDVDLKTNSQEAFQAFKAEPDKYDLVITDQIMPNLSGEELVKEIRSIRPDMPIILCTGYSTQMNERKANSLSINAFAYKPIVKKEIAKLIRKVLDAS